MKIKVTYFDTYQNNKVVAKIFEVFGWSEISYKFSQHCIIESLVIKIERVLTVNDEEILTEIL